MAELIGMLLKFFIVIMIISIILGAIIGLIASNGPYNPILDPIRDFLNSQKRIRAENIREQEFNEWIERYKTEEPLVKEVSEHIKSYLTREDIFIASIRISPNGIELFGFELDDDGYVIPVPRGSYKEVPYYEHKWFKNGVYEKKYSDMGYENVKQAHFEEFSIATMSLVGNGFILKHKYPVYDNHDRFSGYMCIDYSLKANDLPLRPTPSLKSVL